MLPPPGRSARHLCQHSACLGSSFQPFWWVCSASPVWFPLGFSWCVTEFTIFPYAWWPFGYHPLLGGPPFSSDPQEVFAHPESEFLVRWADHKWLLSLELAIFCSCQWLWGIKVLNCNVFYYVELFFKASSFLCFNKYSQLATSSKLWWYFPMFFFSKGVVLCLSHFHLQSLWNWLLCRLWGRRPGFLFFVFSM